MKRLIFLVPVAAFVGLAIFLGLGLTRDPKVIPSQLIDKPLPAFALPGVEAGGGFATAGLKGPLLLNVWASWCTPCQQEHPMLTRIAGEGVPVYGLAWKDKPADSRAWLARFGNPFKAVGADVDGRAGIDLGLTGVPETFVIDARGRVRMKQTGPITPEDWEQKIKPLLARLQAEA